MATRTCSAQCLRPMRQSPYYATVLAVIRHFFFLCGRLAPSCGSCSTLFSCGAVGTVASHHIMTANQQWKSLQCTETLTACLPQTAPCRRPCLSMWFVDADSPGMYRQVGPQPVPQLVKQLFFEGNCCRLSCPDDNVGASPDRNCCRRRHPLHLWSGRPLPQQLF